MSEHSGSIINPLSQYNDNFRPASRYWDASTNLMAVLEDVIAKCDTLMESHDRKAHATAKQYLRTLIRVSTSTSIIPHHTSSDDENSCLIMRLSANLTLEPRESRGEHESPFAVVTIFGDLGGGEMRVPLLERIGFGRMRQVWGKPGDVVLVKEGIEVGNKRCCWGEVPARVVFATCWKEGEK